MRRDSLFTISADAPFLATLAARVLDGTLLGDWPREGPFWLADVTIILPTRRARARLAEAFATQLGGAALLPDLRTFGGEAADEEPFLPPFDLPALPQPVPPLERTLTLARLVDAWARSEDGRAVVATPPAPAEIFALAASLGTVLDDLSIEGGDLGRIDEHVGKLDLAENWRQARLLLDIATRFWPEMLVSAGRADAAVLRNERLRRQAATAPQVYGERPVIAAGSTGSIPATADLLAAIAALPRGALVLPGLDTGLSADAHLKLLDDRIAPHSHPQHALARLLRRLGTTHGAVIELAAPPGPRLAMLRAALALRDDTAGWMAARTELAPVLEDALAGLSIIAARTEDDEARAIAIAARAALAEGRTVGIVAPDQTLSRRIAAELQRFEIEVDDAAGEPLYQSAAGRLLRLALSAAQSRCAPVDLMALLDNRAVELGLGRAEVARLARQIDLGLLRGQRQAVGFAGLRKALADNVSGKTDHPALKIAEPDAPRIEVLLAALEAALAPLTALLALPTLDARSFAAALAASHAALTAGGQRQGVDDRQLAEFLSGLAEAADAGPAFAPVALDQVLATLMAGSKVTNPAPRRSDIQIWGRLEARLMRADLMVLCGLNEEVWPEIADPGPWLSRGMRLAAGLSPPEQRQGQAAHDFEMAAAAGEVVLAFAERRGTSPALPSRLLQRLEAFVGAAATKTLRARGRRWLDEARRLDMAPEEPVPARRPTPSPPVARRPKQLSVTEVETLFRSPYDLYARYTLALKPIPALGEAIDARERGAMIHEVFARFVIEAHDFADPAAPATLRRMAEEAFAGLEAIGERRDIWLRRFERAAAGFLAYERERTPRLVSRAAEIKGRWEMPSGFVLTGRADRVDLRDDGQVELLDFKTGGIPAPKTMRAFEAPQLLLEAAMVRAGAFAEVPHAAPAELAYIKIGLGPEAFEIKPFQPQEGFSLEGAADEIVRRLQGHVEALLLSDARPLAARIRPDPSRRFRGAYDHLARLEEWALTAGEDE